VTEVVTLTDLLRLMEREFDAITDDGEATHLTWTLAAFIEQAKTTLSIWEGHLIEVNKGCVWNEPIEVGGHRFTIRPAAKRERFDNDRILGRIESVLADECYDRETGERVAHRVVRKMAEVTGARTPSFSGWRSSTLKAMGIARSEYVVESNVTGRPSISWEGTKDV
jgi:hypothetical protein